MAIITSKKNRILAWCWRLACMGLLILGFASVRLGLAVFRENRALAATIGSTGLDSLTVQRTSWQPNLLCRCEMSIGANWLFELSLRTVRFEAQGPLIDDERLCHLGELTGLEKLSLRDAHISDAGLRQLTALTNLHSLEVPGAPITDRGLGNLTRLNRLAYLDVRRTQVTAAGIARFQAALPMCRVAGP